MVLTKIAQDSENRPPSETVPRVLDLLHVDKKHIENGQIDHLTKVYAWPLIKKHCST